MAAVKSFSDRLKDGDNILVAEGYLFEFEAKGYLKMGPFVPQVVLEHPDLVREMHREFVHAGSDVVLAFTYYAQREKMRLIGIEDEVHKLNKTALKIAREVANETGTLMAGDISNTTIYDPDKPETHEEVYKMFKEQVQWAVEGGADFMLCESIDNYGEAELALKAVNEFGKGLPAVVTLFPAKNETTTDGIPYGEAFNRLQKAGAAVVGLNCCRGPATMLPVLQKARQDYKGPLAALPVCYRTSEECVKFGALRDINDPDQPAFPADLPPWLCSQKQIAEFTRQAKALGVQYFGLCCGNRAHYTRTMAENLGRNPPASRYSPEMALHPSRMRDDRYSTFQKGFYENQ